MTELDDDPVTGHDLVHDGLESAFSREGPGASPGIGRVVDPDVRIQGVVEVLAPSFGAVVAASWGHCAVAAQPECVVSAERCCSCTHERKK